MKIKIEQLKKKIREKLRRYTEMWKEYVSLKDSSMTIWFRAKKETLKWVLELIEDEN